MYYLSMILMPYKVFEQMKDREVIDKYDILYESCIEFCSRIGLCNKDNVVHVSDEEISLLCKRIDTTLPPALWSYTRFFGNGVSLNNSEYIMTHSILDYEHAYSIANMRIEDECDGMTLKEILNTRSFKVNYDGDSPEDNEGIYTPEIKSLMNIDDIFVYYYDSFNRSFKFVDSSKENPFIYYLVRYEALTSYFSSFTDRCRDLMFMYIVNMAPFDFKGPTMFFEKSIFIAFDEEINYSGGYEWIKTYQDILKKLTASQRETLKRLRGIFYELNNEVEQRENRILSFSEFEGNFIDFLKSEKWF